MSEEIKDMYDIGLVIVQNRNIGNNITNMALYSVLEALGYKVLMIDAPSRMIFRQVRTDKNRFTLFLRNPVMQKNYFMKENPISYEQLNDICKIFVVGSDQLWRSMFVEETDYYTCLDWVKSYKYKISYATSTGVDVFEGTNDAFKRFQYLLKRFQAVSVRELSGKRYLEETTGISAELVLDPVFLCDIRLYKDMALIGRERIPAKPYVASYILDARKSIEQTLAYVSHLLTEGSYNLILEKDTDCDDGTEPKVHGMFQPAIEEWIASIYYADYFITDSFHGICFAIIFQKDFIVIFERDNWRGYNRIYDILNMLGLGDRLLDQYDEAALDSLLAKKIDYDAVGEKLNRLIGGSRNWLEDILRKGFEWTGNYDEYDAAMDWMKKGLGNFRSDLFLRDMDIVAWGGGACFWRNIGLLKKQCGNRFRYVCDSDSDKWGMEYDGIQCISPGTLYEMGNVMVIITIDSPGVSLQVANGLMNHGIKYFEHIENFIKFME